MGKSAPIASLHFPLVKEGGVHSSWPQGLLGEWPKIVFMGTIDATLHSLLPLVRELRSAVTTLSVHPSSFWGVKDTPVDQP